VTAFAELDAQNPFRSSRSHSVKAVIYTIRDVQ